MSSHLKNYVAIVLDRSGSMDVIRQDTIDAFNAQVDKIKVACGDQETTISLLVFSDETQMVFFDAEASHVPLLDRATYVPSGFTALLDGIATAIRMFTTVPDANQEHVSFLVITITDGGENKSRKYSEWNGGVQKIAAMIKETQDTGRWTYAFLMPPGVGKQFSERYSVPIDNIREWSATKQGVREASVATMAGFDKYFSARKAGQRSVAAFYCTTDLSGVDRATIHSKLIDISKYFKVYEVPTESRIDEFISGKTKLPYIVGSGYYLLMKKELVQPHKKVLIMEKGQKAIWGGPEARDLIGLPSDADAKVTPGNHSNYDIFIQSKAPNRKLPRGTKVIYDPSHTSEANPTWDYETAYAEAEKKLRASAAI